MATTKLTIAIDEEQLSDVRAMVAKGRAPSVSAFVRHAVNNALQDAASWHEMLKKALEQTGGPLTKQERAWADAILSPKIARKQKAL